MVVNYFTNEEAFEKIQKAIEWERCNINLSIIADSIHKLEAICKSNNSTESDIKTAVEKIEKLNEGRLGLVKIIEETDETHREVIMGVSNCKNEYTYNSATAIRNILRLSVCDENSKYFKYAILVDNDEFGQFYDAMVELHKLDSCEIGNNGLRIYSQNAQKIADKLEEGIQKFVKNLFSIPVENKFTKKINVKFNKTELNALHETFVTGVKTSVKKQKNGDSVIDDYGYNYAIKKAIKKDNSVQYNGKRFCETFAKLAFTRLFKNKKVKQLKQPTLSQDVIAFKSLNNKDLSQSDLDIIYETYQEMKVINKIECDGFEQYKIMYKNETITINVVCGE